LDAQHSVEAMFNLLLRLTRRFLADGLGKMLDFLETLKNLREWIFPRDCAHHCVGRPCNRGINRTKISKLLVGLYQLLQSRIEALRESRCTADDSVSIARLEQ
jgi:hypothetical protein